MVYYYVDELAKEYVISFYDRTLHLFGDRPESLRWTSEGQRAHYEAMLDIACKIDGRKILDFGCGKGDFYQFLKDKGMESDYTGYDINQNLIALARQKFPGIRFEVCDIERDTISEEFDYVFVCGVFNLNVQGIDELIRFSLKKLFRCCRIGLAFNALSAHAPQKAYDLHYTSPEALLGFALDHLSPFVAMRHDRIPHDFTMFVYRELNSKP
ncbi:MAG TPA: class I SAM-dependent methyltransferase [Thermodesulfovibrionales bacterium]|nr:class I SAM-dependent methyltransferase [Thermodesulfovibrionales bacterium]